MDVSAVRAYLAGLQERIVARLEAIDGGPFLRDAWDRPEGGGGVSRLIEDGAVLERGGVNFSDVRGASLPPSAPPPPPPSPPPPAAATATATAARAPHRDVLRMGEA